MTEWLSVVGYPAEQRHSSGRNPHRIARIRSAQGKPWHYPGISVTIRLRLSADGVGSLVDSRGSPDDRKESLRFRHRSRCSLDDGTYIDSIDELSLSLHPALRTGWVKKSSPAVFWNFFPNCWEFFINFYRAMHFSAKRDIAIACRLSVCPDVCNVGELWSHRLEIFENNFTLS